MSKKDHSICILSINNRFSSYEPYRTNNRDIKIYDEILKKNDNPKDYVFFNYTSKFNEIALVFLNFNIVKHKKWQQIVFDQRPTVMWFQHEKHAFDYFINTINEKIGNYFAAININEYHEDEIRLTLTTKYSINYKGHVAYISSNW